MLDVLIFMYTNYMQEPTGSHIGIQNHIAKELSEAGFDYQDSLGAINWYITLRSMLKNKVEDTTHTEAIRIYTQAELERIAPDSLDFIALLQTQKAITSDEREVIIDRALALTQNSITIEEIRWVTMMVLNNDQSRKEQYLFIEDALFNLNNSTVH